MGWGPFRPVRSPPWAEAAAEECPYLPSRAFLGFWGCHALIHVIRVLIVLVWAACQGQRLFPRGSLCGPAGRLGADGSCGHTHTCSPSRGLGPRPPDAAEQPAGNATRKAAPVPSLGFARDFHPGASHGGHRWARGSVVKSATRATREPARPPLPPRPAPHAQPMHNRCSLPPSPQPPCPILPGQAPPPSPEPLVSPNIPTALLDSRHCRMDAEFW